MAIIKYKPGDAGPGCWLDPDGYCIVHQTSNMAVCANSKMNGYKEINSRSEAYEEAKRLYRYR